MNNTIKYYSTVDTIILTQNVNEKIYDKAINNQSVNVAPYTCIRSGSNCKKALEIGDSDHRFNFLHIELEELPNLKTFNLRIVIHLNHFIHQAFPNESYVKSEKIIKDLESIISRYLRFPGFNLDVMNVSRIDIALDFLVKKDPSHYLNIIKHKEMPRHLFRNNNNSNSALSIHSYSYNGGIDLDKNSTYKGAVYNKSDKLGIEKNIMRFEFRFEGDQINELPLDILSQQGYCDIISEEKGVTKFSDIFCADIGEKLKNGFIDGIILKDSEEYDAIESHDNYISNHRDWIDRFANADEYYSRLALLLKQKNDINKKLREICEIKPLDQIEDDQETLNELWLLIESNLKDEFIYQLRELETPVDKTLLLLKDLYSKMEIFDFHKELKRLIPPKRKNGVDQADLSTKKLIHNYFKERLLKSNLRKRFMLDKRRDITKRINTLRYEFRTFNKFMFICQLEKDYDGTKGQELYNELKTLANSYSFTPSVVVFNLYKQYSELSDLKEVI